MSLRYESFVQVLHVAFEAFCGVFQLHSRLSSTPTTLSGLSIVELFLIVLFKYPLRKFGELIGFLPRLEYDAAKNCFDLPLSSVSAPLTLSGDDLQKYSSSVLPSDTGFKQGDKQNPVFILVPLTTPLLLHLLSKFTNPILPLGSVNVRNRFEFIDPEACRNLQANQGHLLATATLGGPASPGKPVKRGVQIDLTISVTLNGKLIFKQIFTVLQFLQHHYPKLDVNFEIITKDIGAYDRILENRTSMFTVDFDAPARWARLCKDYNPIHVSSLAARLFGFPSKIAHGNLVVGILLERFMRDEMESRRGAYYLEVAFKRPIIVPQDLEVLSFSTDQPRKDLLCNFEVLSTRRKPEKVYIQGQINRL